MIKDYFKLSYASLKNRGLRSWLTVVGIFIGIAAVVSLIGLGEGLRIAVMSQFNFLSTDVLLVQASGLNAGPPGTGVVNPLRERYVDDMEEINGVEMVISRLIEDAKLEFNGIADFTFAASIPEDEKSKELQRIVQIEIDNGRMIREKDSNKAVLGSNYGMPDRFGVAIKLRDKIRVQGEEFDVVGILKKKGSFILDNAILMNENELKDLFNKNDTVDVILVKVEDVSEISAVRGRVEKYLRNERGVDEGEEDFSVESPEQSLKNLNLTLFAIQIFIYVIAGISIVVGGIGISNTMYTSVLERTKDIGIMKSVGAKRSNIFGLFLIESGLLGLVGGLVGIIVGVSISHGLAMLGKIFFGSELISVSITWYLILGALLFSFVVGSVAGLMPALQASKLHPVKALGYAK